MRHPTGPQPDLDRVEEKCFRFLEGCTTAPTFSGRGTVVTIADRREIRSGYIWAVSAVPRVIGKGVEVVVGQYGPDQFFIVDAKS